MSTPPIQDQPFYDPNLTYEENCQRGPFGGFADSMEYVDKGEPDHDFLGHKVYLPFGIPAGPLPTANFCKAAFKKGFDVLIYKTVRTREHPCNPFPNVVPVKTNGELTLEQAAKGLVISEGYKAPIAITNSFGVPCFAPEFWQKDMKEAVESARKGQLLIASYQGSKRGEGEAAFIEDWVRGAKMILETGAKVIELNLSCPNEGSEHLLCHDTKMVTKIATAVRNAVGDTPLLLKMSYFTSDQKLKNFIEQLAPIVDGFDAINTIAGAVRKPDGTQALPGEGRLISGVCGAPIKWAGLEMVQRLKKFRDQLDLDFVIIGTGGVTTPKDYRAYRDAGADVVMSATGAMWNTNLAKQIKEQLL